MAFVSWHIGLNFGCSLDRGYNVAKNIKHGAVGHFVLKNQATPDAIAGVAEKPTLKSQHCMYQHQCKSMSRLFLIPKLGYIVGTTEGEYEQK
jgi:hypothetical protein